MLTHWTNWLVINSTDIDGVTSTMAQSVRFTEGWHAFKRLTIQAGDGKSEQLIGP